MLLGHNPEVSEFEWGLSPSLLLFLSLWHTLASVELNFLPILTGRLFSGSSILFSGALSAVRELVGSYHGAR